MKLLRRVILILATLCIILPCIFMMCSQRPPQIDWDDARVEEQRRQDANDDDDRRRAEEDDQRREEEEQQRRNDEDE